MVVDLLYHCFCDTIIYELGFVDEVRFVSDSTDAFRVGGVCCCLLVLFVVLCGYFVQFVLLFLNLVFSGGYTRVCLFIVDLCLLLDVDWFVRRYAITCVICVFYFVAELNNLCTVVLGCGN